MNENLVINLFSEIKKIITEIDMEEFEEIMKLIQSFNNNQTFK